jgi:hypothetical protein
LEQMRTHYTVLFDEPCSGADRMAPIDSEANPALRRVEGYPTSHLWLKGGTSLPRRLRHYPPKLHYVRGRPLTPAGGE